MNNDRTLPIPTQPVNTASDTPPDESASGNVLNLSEAFLKIARQAYDDCQHGRDAVDEMQRRRNVSGE